MTLANENPTQKPVRAARDHADVALKAAAEGRWQEAADANRAVLAFAAELEKGAASAYLSTVPVFQNRDLAKAAASIMGAETQHWAVLRAAISVRPMMGRW